MAEEGRSKWVFDLDAKDALDQIFHLKGSIMELGNGKNLEGLVSALKAVGAVAGLVGAAILAAKAAIDWTEEGEQLEMINKSFQAMASNAGISDEALKSGLEHSSKGLIETTELLQAANKGISELGENAKHLPEIMDLARKATLLYGGSAIERFQDLNRAIASGQTRMLRQVGIFVDADKAAAKYAVSIGTTKSALTEAQKQQAIMNEVLSQGSKRYSGVDGSSKQVTVSMKQLGVTLHEIKETFIIVFERTIGPLLKKVLDVVNSSLSVVKRNLMETFGSETEKAQANVERLTKVLLGYHMAIKENQDYIDRYHKGELSFWEKLTYGSVAGGSEKTRLDAIERYKKSIADTQKQIEELNKVIYGSGGEGQSDEAKERRKAELAEQAKLRAEQQTKFEKDLLAARNQRLQAEIENETSIQEVEMHHAEQKKMLDEQESRRIEELNQARINGVITQQQYEDMATEVMMERRAREAESEDKLNQRRIDATQRFADRSQTLAEGMSRTWQAESVKAEQANKNMALHGQIVFGALKNNAVSAFKAIGDGSKNASEAFKGFMYGAIGDVAEAKGEMLLTEGIATLNPAYVAAGGALIALGSYLKSQANTSSSGNLSGGGGGGGGGLGASASSSEKPEQKEAQKKTVNINVQGNYFETEQTKTRLMEMVREATDATDFNYKQIGQ